MSVTDGNLTTDGAQQTVRVIGAGGTTTLGSVNQGTAAAPAGAWPIKLVDSLGVNVANVYPSGAVKVQVDPATTTFTTTGVTTSTTTINALTAVGPGVVVDFGSAKANISCVFATTAGISAGAVALEVSHDNISYFRTAAPVTLTASAVSNIVISSNAFRYARGAITTTVVGGTVSATLMAS
jgi:hypothetical protein